jgi:hypothetical protein
LNNQFIEGVSQRKYEIKQMPEEIFLSTTQKVRTRTLNRRLLVTEQLMIRLP